MAKRTHKKSSRAKAPAKRKRARSGQSRGRKVLGWAVRWGVVTGIWATVLLIAVVGWYAYDLPDIDDLQKHTRRASVTLTAADGSVIAAYGDLYARPVQLDEVPPYLVQAIIAIEDRRFFDHSGFDPWAVMRAAYVNFRTGKIRQGGSTITQQLAKNLFLTPARTVRRKVRELLIALWLEAKFSKRQIFTIYINRVYLGAGTYGVEAASRRYFGVSARRIDLQQAAVLAGLLKAPTRLAPSHNPKGAAARARVVLQRMVAVGFLSRADARRAMARPPRWASGRNGGGFRYFTDWILERATDYIGHTGADLVIHTTLDPRLQAAAERRLTSALEKNGPNSKVTQGAMVVMSPNGAVRALVGGRDYRASQFNRATQALRQPGSAFKLFVYLAALEAGQSPDDKILDAPLRVQKWRPRNHDGVYRGPTTMRDAFARSANTVAVRTSESVGRENVIAVARRLGITSRLKPHPSLALGASEVTLLELTAAYAVIPNNGWGVWPYAITEIRDRSGKPLYRRAGSGPGRAIAVDYLAPLHDMLTAVISYGTGRRAAIDRPAAGKTGTSQKFRDAWFVGYTADLVAGVWVGNDNGAPMKRVSGGGLPAGLWRDFMRDAFRGKAPDLSTQPVAAAPPSVLPAVTDRYERLLPPRKTEPQPKAPSSRFAPSRPWRDEPDYQD